MKSIATAAFAALMLHFAAGSAALHAADGERRAAPIEREPARIETDSEGETSHSVEGIVELQPREWFTSPKTTDDDPTRSEDWGTVAMLLRPEKPLVDFVRLPADALGPGSQAVTITGIAKGLRIYEQIIERSEADSQLEKLDRFWNERIGTPSRTVADPNERLTAFIENFRGPDFAKRVLEPGRHEAVEREKRRELAARIREFEREKEPSLESGARLVVALKDRLDAAGVSGEMSLKTTGDPESMVRVAPSSDSSHWLARLSSLLNETGHKLKLKTNLILDGTAGTQGSSGISLAPRYVESETLPEEAEHELGHLLVHIAERLDGGDEPGPARARARIEIKPPEDFRFSLARMDSRLVDLLRRHTSTRRRTIEKMKNILGRAGVEFGRTPDIIAFIEHQLMLYADRYVIEETWTYRLSAKQHLDRAELLAEAWAKNGRARHAALLRESAAGAIQRAFYGLGIAEATTQFLIEDLQEIGAAAEQDRGPELRSSGRALKSYPASRIDTLQRALAETELDRSALAAIAERAATLLESVFPKA